LGNPAATKFFGIEAVLFDAVGTLIYPVPPAAEVYQRAGAALGAALSLEEVDRRFRAAFAAAFADSGATSNALEKAKWREVVCAVFRNTPAPLDRLFPVLWDHFSHSEHWSVFPDVAPLWEELEARGLRLGIASNYDDRLPGALAGLPPLDRCEHVFWSSRVGFGKPHAEYFQFIARSLNLPPERILMVGDDPEKDIAGARAAGWNTVLLDRKNRVRSSQSIGTLAALPALLD
jgi:putative hydrolase of the HAD superfamily